MAKKTISTKGKWDTKIVSYRHDDSTRANNPDVGLVTPDTDPTSPKTEWQYDPHIDPALQFDSARAAIETVIDDALASGDAEVMRQALATLKRMQQPYLNWTGKAERTSFEVDTVSLHVHERIDPASILSALRKQVKGASNTHDLMQMGLFHAPFEEVPLRDAIQFYKHERGWSNRLVAGDSLLVMNSLLQKESMAGQVQMIYIDPPYGIKYGSNFQPFVNKRDVKDGKDEDLTQEPEMIKAFRDTWELGIHSYLTYLRDRLLLARELLSETGSVFVQISDENVHHVRELMDEVFGAANFVTLIVVKKTAGQTDTLLASVSDFVVWYAKDASNAKYRRLTKSRSEEMLATRYRHADKGVTANDGTSSVGRMYRITSLSSQTGSDGTQFEYMFHGTKYSNPVNRGWSTNRDGLDRVVKSYRGVIEGKSLNYKRYIDDYVVESQNSLWTDLGGGALVHQKLYVVQTAESVPERCLLMTTDPGDLVLDITCGSGTTAVVAEKWGRRWITCDTSRVAITLAKQRLMTASFDYYELRYPEEGLKGGFIYDTVPHVTLKSIANNAEIDVIYDEMHPRIEKALSDLNAALQKHANGVAFTVTEGVRKKKTVKLGKDESLFEWEVPFDFPEGWPSEASAPFSEFHEARIAMQKKMDASIAAHADQEVLYDRPKVAKNKLRITGPFTVEAVPFPSVTGMDEAAPAVEADASVARSGETSRQNRWRDELLKTGVRGKSGQKLEFSSMETVPGLRSIHADARVKDTGERVLVSFGPDHAALEQRQVEMAIREADTLRPKASMILFCALPSTPRPPRTSTTWTIPV